MRFGSLSALNEVSFPIESGRVHAILGENGAGKSTLMKILAGELCPSSGAVKLCGVRRIFASPRAAKLAGIRFVHQHLSLIPALTITENFVLESSSTACPLGITEASLRIQEAALDFGLSVDPLRRVSELSMSERQWLEVFRAIFLGSDILILDEPTALLSPVEGDLLLEKIRGLAKSGKTVILITHKLREIIEFADVVTVLRKGQFVGTYDVASVSPEMLSSTMVGKENKSPDLSFNESKNVSWQSLIETDSVSARDSRGFKVLAGVSISIRKGEVHGIAGVAGNGQTELVEILAGLRSPDSGNAIHATEDELVVRYVPASRMTEATAGRLSILENLILRDYHVPSHCVRGVLNWSELRALGDRKVSDFQIKIGTLDDSPTSLSGGNIQRVVLAREMGGTTNILIVHNPTSGIDLPSSLFVRSRIRRAALDGVGVLMISDDLDEIMQVSDRISVLHSGRIAGELSRSEFSRERIAELMVGHQRANGNDHSVDE
jgi:ABC-type uncharacterized transport system ATPase subunit